MKITPTLSRYLVKCYIVNFLVLLLALLSIVYLFDTVELIRRASKQQDVPLSLVLEMGLFKLPDVGQILLPFAILFSAMFTFWQLTRRYELIVVRASGFSVWQFLTPVAGLAITIGLLQITVINPVGATLISTFQQMERTYLSHQENDIAVFREGLWLRQAVMIESDAPKDTPQSTDSQPPHQPQTQTSNLISGYVILHAGHVRQPDWILQDVTALYFTDDNNFLQRVDATTATLKGKNWIMHDATIHKAGFENFTAASYQLPTTLTIEDIEESFSSPRSMSFWKLPDHIKTLERTGFDATRLKVHYQNLLSQPLLFAAMVLLAATVSMRPPRSGKTFMIIALGVFLGFIVFFLSSFLQALGSNGQIPVFLAAWSPALICFLLGLSAMMTIEDG